jgi:hypothetical protein
MAISIKHAFQSAIADDPTAAAAGDVLPSHWNASLSTSMATGRLLGRTTASAGAFEEIAAGSGISLSALSLSFDTTWGDGRYARTTAVRELLTNVRTYYVNASTGSNSNNGLTSGAPFATLAYALFICSTIDFGGQYVAIELAPGTYGPVDVPVMVGQPSAFALNIYGTNRDTCIIQNTVEWAAAVRIGPGAACYITNLKIISTGGTNGGVGMLAQGGTLYWNAINFGNCRTGISASDGGVAGYNFSSTKSILSGSLIAAMFFGESGGIQTCFGGEIDAQGGAFSTGSGFAYAFSNATMTLQGTTFSNFGSVTGPRFYAAAGGIINTWGSGVNYLPGSSAGYADATTFGLYA